MTDQNPSPAPTFYATSPGSAYRGASPEALEANAQHERGVEIARRFALGVFEVAPGRFSSQDVLEVAARFGVFVSIHWGSLLDYADELEPGVFADDLLAAFKEFLANERTREAA